jgi:hypothetical protein
MFIAELRTTAERSVAVDTDAMSSAQVPLVNETGRNEEFGDGVPRIFSGMTPKANPVEQQNQIPLTTQAEALLPGSTSAQPAHFSSQFLRETNGGNTLNHMQRSRARARLRSIRRKEELAFELGM